MKKLTLLFTLFLTASILVFAQQAKIADWKVNTGKAIKWVRVTPTGFVVAAADDALYGINPNTRAIAWTMDNLTGVSEDSYENLDGSPLFIIKEGGNDKISLVHSVTGKVLYSSAKDGFTKINKRSFFIPIGAVLIDGQIGDVHALTLVDMDNGTQKWLKKFEEMKSGGLVAKLTVVAKPILDNDNNLLYSTKEKLYRLNSSSGEIMWEKQFDKKIGATYVTPDNSRVIVITGSLSNSQKEEQAESSSMVVSSSGTSGTFMMDMIKLADGSNVWAEPVKIKSKFSGLMLGDKDLFAFYYAGCNIFDYATGKAKWDKDAKAGGDEVIKVNTTDKGFLITTAYKPSVTHFRYIGFDGNPLWKKQPQTSYGVREVRDNGKGLFYLAPGGADVIDINTGEYTWNKDKNINFDVDKGVVFLYDETNDAYVVFNNGTLYLFDLKTLTNKILYKGLSFKGSEMPEQLEKRDGGYLLSSSQNMALVDFSGKLVFNTYFEAPEMSFGSKLALGLVSSAAAVVALDNMASSQIAGVYGTIGNNQELKNLSDDYARKASVAAGISGGAYEMMNARFKASANAQNDVLILTKPVNSAGSAMLMKVNKDTGAAGFSISLDTKKPKFVVDPIDNKMYYISGDNELSCYVL